MKVLIPTDDCLTIAPDFDRAKKFRLITIINGYVREDTFITSSFSSGQKRAFGLNGQGENTLPEVDIKDGTDPGHIDEFNCRIAIIQEISSEAEKSLQKINYEVIHSEETNIINALTSYMKNHATKESDYCCSP
jgi:hypothetical protein